MTEPKFKNGDRAVVTQEIASHRPDLIGQVGTVVDQIEELPALLYIKLDDPNLAGNGDGGSWAVMEHELEKVED